MRALAPALACVCLLAQPLFAADGDIDPTFSLDGTTTVLWDEVSNGVGECA